MKKTALTASAITLLAGGVGLGEEATASGSVSATATASSYGRVCLAGGICDWGPWVAKEEGGWRVENGVNTFFTKKYNEASCNRCSDTKKDPNSITWEPYKPTNPF